VKTAIRYGVIWVVIFLVLVAAGSTAELEGLLSDAVVASSGMTIHLSTHVAYYLFTIPTGSLATSSIIGVVVLAIALLRKAMVAYRSSRH
tara:strand:+ start:194 stop:463 length:270 start_codon:yes stop_codon:yes gene_type:complete